MLEGATDNPTDTVKSDVLLCFQGNLIVYLRKHMMMVLIMHLVFLKRPIDLKLIVCFKFSF